jgi:hypothetical protein
VKDALTSHLSGDTRHFSKRPYPSCWKWWLWKPVMKCVSTMMAPRHTNVICQYLDETFSNRWILSGGPITWPPRSPDFTLWGYMQSLVYETTWSCGKNCSSSWNHPGNTGNLSKSSAYHSQAVQNIQWSWRPPFWTTFIRKTTITSPKIYASSRKMLWPLVPKGSVSGHGCTNKHWTHLSTTKRCNIFIYTLYILFPALFKDVS